MNFCENAAIGDNTSRFKMVLDKLINSRPSADTRRNSKGCTFLEPQYNYCGSGEMVRVFRKQPEGWW